MARNIKVGIDIGTYQVKVAVSESVLEKDKHVPRILGVGFAESKGMRHGHIINAAEVTRSIRLAVQQAEKSSGGFKIRKAYVSIGGMGLNSTYAKGTTIISRADSEITELDVKKVIQTSESALPKNFMANRHIIHVIPTEYKVDGEVVMGRPVGFKGNRLEVTTMFVTALERHFQDTIAAVNEAEIQIEDIVAAPIAASLVTLNRVQKTAGCVLANIGAETVSLIVYENNIPTSIEVFPIGSTDITNDIALGLKIPLEEAEDIKMGNTQNLPHSKKKLDEIIEARLSDIFELIEAHLKKIGRNGLLPAGIIISGGGSGLDRLQDFARASLRLPSKIASFNFTSHLRVPIKDATWAVAYGLCILGFTNGEDITEPHSQTKNLFKSWLKQFWP